MTGMGCKYRPLPPQKKKRQLVLYNAIQGPCSDLQNGLPKTLIIRQNILGLSYQRCVHIGDTNVVGNAVDVNLKEYQENFRHMSDLVSNLRNIAQNVLNGGGPEAIKRHTPRGK